MTEKTREPGAWLTEAEKLRLKHIMGICLRLNKDAGTDKPVIEIIVYRDRPAEGDAVARSSYHTYTGPYAQKLAQRWDVAMRGHSMAVFPMLGASGTAPIVSDAEWVGMYDLHLDSQPWQYTCLLSFNAVPKYQRVWDPTRRGVDPDGRPLGAWVTPKRG